MYDSGDSDVGDDSDPREQADKRLALHTGRFPLHSDAASGPSVWAVPNPILEPYAPEEIDLVLVTVAVNAGNVTRSLKILKEHDPQAFGKLGAETVRSWKGELYEQRYFELQEEHSAAIAHRAAARSMEIADLAAVGVEKFVVKAIEGAEKIIPETAAEARDLATSARNLSQVQVNSVEKARLLRDQPTEVHSLESLDELVATLQAAGVVPGVVDAEAVEEEAPAELEPANAHGE